MTSEQALLVTLIVIAVWLIVICGFAVYFVKKVMPDIRKLRETREGQRELIKALFPPRFFRD